MGTRGLIAFHIDGVTKAAYQQWDAYPEGQAVPVLEYIRGKDIDALKRAASGLRVVTNETPPTAEQVEALRGYADRGVASKELTDWYVLLRKTQGDAEAILASGYVEDSFDFGYDSLFCEWATVVDLDAGNLDVYRGFNQSGKVDGLWAEVPEGKARDGDYGPVTRVGSFPLTDLPTGDALVAAVDPDVDES